MHAPDTYDYAVVRVVPRVERGEFLNVGVVLSCERLRFLEARFALDPARLLALAPGIDLDTVQRHLAGFAAICAGAAGAGPIARLPQRARFHWLTAPRSAIIQTSPAHAGRCDDPEAALAHLLARMVAVDAPMPRAPRG
jgi:hypothetical protein